MNVLLTSVGRRSYIVDYFKNELGNSGKVIAANSDILTTAMQVADKCYKTPIIYSNDYIPTLLDICKKENISFLISLFDIDLPILAKNRAEFEKLGIKLIVPSLEAVNICNDKLKMCEFLNELQLPTVYTESDKKHFSYIENELKKGKSFMIKPRWGMGSLDIFEVKNVEELRVLYKKAKSNLEDSYLKFEAKNDFDKSIIVQEKLIGKEYGIDVINDLKGNYVRTVVREKIAMRSGETDIAKVIEHKEIEKLGEMISNKLKHIANLDIDIIESNNKYYVIDMNVRFGGGYPFSHSAGINLPRAIISWVKGENADKAYFVAEYGNIYAKNIDIKKLRNHI